MKPEPNDMFKTSKAGPARFSMITAIGVAKEAVASMSVLDFDSVGRCERRAEGGWTVHLDLIESIARMGDNDLLATYEVEIDAEGEPLQVSRTRRYHREDRDQS